MRAVSIKPGYKQTEVGLIPEDWEDLELGRLLKSTQLGGNYNNSTRETSKPLIKMGNLGRGYINLDKLDYIDASQAVAPRDRLHFGDVLFNTRNTLDLVGRWRFGAMNYLRPISIQTL
jgi:type I restriction enzyme S subunit